MSHADLSEDAQNADRTDYFWCPLNTDGTGHDGSIH